MVNVYILAFYNTRLMYNITKIIRIKIKAQAKH